MSVSKIHLGQFKRTPKEKLPGGNTKITKVTKPRTETCHEIIGVRAGRNKDIV